MSKIEYPARARMVPVISRTTGEFALIRAELLNRRCRQPTYGKSSSKTHTLQLVEWV